MVISSIMNIVKNSEAQLAINLMLYKIAEWKNVNLPQI